MSEPVNHHYVSQFFQRNFANERGCLFFFDKRCPEKGIREKRPKKIFAEEYLNSIMLKDGTLDAGLEKWYNRLETKTAPVVKRLIAAAEAQKPPQLTVPERKIWFNFVYHQQKRAPDAFSRLGLVASLPDDLPHAIAEYERRAGRLSDEERAEVLSEAGIRRLTQLASVKARGEPSQEVVDVLAARGLAIAWITSPKKSFVLGDHPMARMGVDASLAGTELWFPISSRVAVSPFGKPNSEVNVALDDRQVRRTNEIIWTQSNVIASRSAQLLRSLGGDSGAIRSVK